jgi:hypothetical protein
MHLLSADGARPLGPREDMLLKVNPLPCIVIVFVNPKFGTPVMKRTQQRSMCRRKYSFGRAMMAATK